MRLIRAARALPLAAATSFLALPSIAQAQSDTWALTNARIQTVTKGVIEKGTIIVRNGLIEAVGANITIPKDARVMDLGGKTISPGLIDLTSSLGLPTAPAPTGGGFGGGGGGGGQAQSGPRGIEAERDAAEDLKVTPGDIRPLRDAGVTAVLVAPSRGLFRGTSALVPLRDSVAPSDIVRDPVAMHIGYQGVQGDYPGSLLGVITYQRQALYDAQHQSLLLDRYKSNPRGMARPEMNARVDALVPVVKGDLPAFIEANNENEIRRASRLTREFNLKTTIVGATEGWLAIDALAGRGVVVSVNYPQPTQVTGWSYRLSERRAPNDSAGSARAVQKMVEGNAAALNKAGVRFAMASGGNREFVPNVRKAIAAGLPADVALQAVTIRAAEMAGAGETLGSIEAGKIANLVVTNGDLLSDSAKVSSVFVDGIRYDGAPATAARPANAGNGAGATGGGAPAQLAGNWTMTLNSPQGPLDITMTVTQNGTSFTGSMTSMMGTTNIDEGQVAGRNATWSMTMQVGGQAITLNYRGQVEGNRMTGTAELGSFGNATFTAERRP